MSYLANYAGSDRHYHTFEHIGKMISDLNKYFPEYKDDQVLKDAIMYHDCIYRADAPSGSNEMNSFNAAAEELKISPYSGKYAELKGLIMATHKHENPVTMKQAIIIDLDLAGLASDNYMQNSINVRKEYHIFSDLQWLRGRKAFLDSFMGRKIYQTETGQQWENRAKLNLADELVHVERKLFQLRA
ncbi:hypothetical protein SEA_WEASELS2_133 [Rhodococcus phage Weasels2]|uniref:Phosphohydrolase n=1 Tax=Rhodococcus phage Weasels2 TaxID=1897437 RepID=A0A1I9SAB2_9CAUD|nr:phosphohydrolase [Rhodococcus phage Weasels2]AOZ63718.1 hypothetical protein SEA_WEASELS2_133 [Rhodococcus phage Weasels2]